ncbi:dimethyladenosine transferase [Gloeomargarita lithophora Alchichica-D10]|uniref:Ribosomal RNA small subunit methyltransferase A n=1 Tax=Gloeomargarita lithophora Alchichica-D10 TaxID=1188229 RepID=A0A1J0A9E7_9CYAN|nr:16S rRNA (adenine(1518)-N(6)/adenine(1519)-N(6))-dimethyltransferase RsmA [Gloeomargarita lithophora]APB32529.1 dimethyladenosine transferase [Gloeomargarita lithophora Alchichica-D10]
MTPRPRKSLAQYWLKREDILQKIVNAAELKATDSVLEIGPGTGNLTRYLLPQVAGLLAVELDEKLVDFLQKKYGHHPHFWLLKSDILTLDLRAELAKNSLFPPPNKVVANIPYHITSPLLAYLVGSPARPWSWPFERVVLLVQKEVAQRLTAKPGGKTFGALSVRMQYIAHCTWVCDVPASAFYPRPQVDSAVICLTPRMPDPVVLIPRRFEQWVQQGFSQRRKMLRNNLPVAQEILAPILTQLGYPETVRAEAISAPDWVRLCNSLSDYSSDSLSEQLPNEPQVNHPEVETEG